MRSYDPNPDVNEVLVYSGAGEARAKRKQEAYWQQFRAIGEESSRRSKAEWAAAERRAKREDRIMFVATFVGIPVVGTLLVICLSWCGS